MSQNKPAKAAALPRRITPREAREAASRLRTDHTGERYVIRFNLRQRIEHLTLLISFTLLAVTGLPQRYADSSLGEFLLWVMGGIETARQIHHLFAVLFGLVSIFHLGVFIYEGFVYRRWGAMWPSWQDARDLFQMMAYNLGRVEQPPRMGRYTFDEKMEYWALVWGALVMGITGVMQWFPTQVTRWLPGSAIPIARAFHSWEAVLAVLAILTWHFYHVMVKHRNWSMFTGKMSLEQMEEEHPLELLYLERAAAAYERYRAAREAASPPQEKKLVAVAPEEKAQNAT